MSKKKTSSRVISSFIHKDFAVFSKSMINDYHLTKEHVNTLKHVDGKLVKVSESKIVNETGKAKYQSVKMPLLVKDKNNPGAIITTNDSDAVNLSNQKISLSNEALLYLIHLAGHTKNVFLYILYYMLNEETLEFRTDSLVQHYYMEFCKVAEYNSKTPSSAMKDAIKKLVEMRLIINVGHNRYMMNPSTIGFIM